MSSDFDEYLGNTSFRVTHIREPIARCISNYKYNRRWSCRHLLNKSFNPTLDNLYMSFNQFIEKKHGYNVRFDSMSAECMSRWATGILAYPGWEDTYKYESQKPKFETNSPLDMHAYSDQLFDAVIDRLMEFDVIIVLEWLKDPIYRQKEALFFDVDAYVLDNHPETAESIAANNKYPLTVKDEWIESLKGQNQVDIRIYNTMTECGKDNVDYGNTTLAQIVQS